MTDTPERDSPWGRGGRQLRAGTVWTNTWALVDDQFEEGGFGQSGPGPRPKAGVIITFGGRVPGRSLSHEVRPTATRAQTGLSAELPGRLNRTRGLEEFQEYKTYAQIVA